jgi:hypothetical protein
VASPERSGLPVSSPGSGPWLCRSAAGFLFPPPGAERGFPGAKRASCFLPRERSDIGGGPAEPGSGCWSPQEPEGRRWGRSGGAGEGVLVLVAGCWLPAAVGLGGPPSPLRGTPPNTRPCRVSRGEKRFVSFLGNGAWLCRSAAGFPFPPPGAERGFVGALRGSCFLPRERSDVGGGPAKPGRGSCCWSPAAGCDQLSAVSRALPSAPDPRRDPLACRR